MPGHNAPQAPILAQGSAWRKDATRGHPAQIRARQTVAFPGGQMQEKADRAGDAASTSQQMSSAAVLQEILDHEPQGHTSRRRCGQRRDNYQNARLRPGRCASQTIRFFFRHNGGRPTRRLLPALELQTTRLLALRFVCFFFGGGYGNSGVGSLSFGRCDGHCLPGVGLLRHGNGHSCGSRWAWRTCDLRCSSIGVRRRRQSGKGHWRGGCLVPRLLQLQRQLRCLLGRRSQFDGLRRRGTARWWFQRSGSLSRRRDAGLRLGLR